MIDCAALQTELDNARALLALMREKSVVRSVRDSDGSSVEYSSSGLTAQQNYVLRLQGMVDTLCSGCGRAAAPTGFVFP